MDLIGRKVGNYQVTRRLGAGGMGTVYICEHPVIGHRLAMKVLHEEHAADAELVQRFFQEARAAASIGHENIIEVLDFGSLDTERGPTVYIMMELLAGSSLTEHQRVHGLGGDDLLHVLAQCCRALQACHAHGIVHRDLKPENIYICPRESDPLFVKIMDFGIAKLLDPDTASARTRVGVALGTPAYMSPEQCAGQGKIDARSDVYSLGVVMYELLTGKRPFGDELGLALRGHMYETPATPCSVDPTIPPAIEAICLRALEKDPARRFQSMAEMLVAVNDPVGHFGAWQAHPPPPPGHSGQTLLLEDVSPSPSPSPSPPPPPPTGEHGAAGELAVLLPHPPSPRRTWAVGAVVIAVTAALTAALLMWIAPLADSPGDDGGAPAIQPARADAAPPDAVIGDAGTPDAPPAPVIQPAPDEQPIRRPPPRRKPPRRRAPSLMDE